MISRQRMEAGSPALPRPTRPCRCARGH